MQHIISDPDDRAQLVTLNHAYEAAQAARAEADAAVAEAGERIRSLRQALAEHAASEPKADPDVSAELSKVLAADPDAVNSTDWASKLAAAQDAHAAALTAWKSKRTVLGQALDRVQDEHDARAAKAARAASAASVAFAHLAETARVAMLAEMKPRWEAFVRDTIAPMEALSRLGTSGPRSTVRFSDAGVMVSQSSTSAVGTWLYKSGEIGDGTARALFETFRAALAAEAASATKPAPSRGTAKATGAAASGAARGE